MQAKLIVAVSLTAMSLAGCGTSKYAEDPLYDAGFSDGCSTGTSRTPGVPQMKPVRDDKIWEDSDAYKAGWRSGYGSCSPGGRGDNTSSDRDVGGR
ncbi:MAG: hypothetical protein SGJ03_03775 [Alphaproteobacteria bacterium]|nr:hypothetical protein [Alphaproteobacteria bacterium]